MLGRWPRIRSLLLAGLCAALAGCGRGEAPGAAFEPDSIPEAYARPTAALMWPGAARAFQVTPEGDLYNGAWRIRIHPLAGGAQAGAPRAIAYEERWLPIAHWTRHCAGVRWSFEAAALPEPAPRDSGLIVSLAVSAANAGTSPREAVLELELAPPDPDPAFTAFDAPDPPDHPARWGSGAGSGEVEGWCDRPASGAVLRVGWTLAPGESRVLRAVLPAYPTPARALANWARATHARRAAEARRYWQAETGRGTRFALGDQDAERALRAATVVLLSCRERRGPRWVPIGSLLHYRDVWLRDGARAVQALAVTGHGRIARELAAGLAEFQWPNGAFLSQHGQLDGTGQALWAFEQAWLRPAPADSAAPFAEAALRAWRWIEGQRAAGAKTGWPFGALMPFGEPRDNELVRAQLVGNDAWAIAGYRSAARLLRSAGRTAEAEAVDASRLAYERDFAAALEHAGSPGIPPSWQGVGRDWGNLAVAWPCAALPAGHPRCAAAARSHWARAGGAGLGYYGSPDSAHYYLAADLGTWALLTGRRAEADSVLDALLRWRSASGGAGEIFSRATGDFGRNLPPHATSAAALLTLVRNMLVFDDTDTLQLTLGARAAWWRGARLERAPTRWGEIDLRFRRAGSSAQWNWTPVPVWTALTLPPGTRLASAPRVPLAAGPSGRVILAPPGAGSAHVELAGEAGR